MKTDLHGEVSITVKGTTHIKLINDLRTVANLLEGKPAEDRDAPEEKSAIHISQLKAEAAAPVPVKTKKVAKPAAEEFDLDQAKKEDEAEPEDDEFAGVGAQAESAPLTEDDVLKAARAYATAHGPDKAKKLLSAKFGVKRVKDLKAAQYPAVVTAMTGS